MTLMDKIRRIVADIVHGRCKFHVSPWFIWKSLWRSKGERCGWIHTKPGAIGFKWGFYVLGFEFANRNGVWPEDRKRNAGPHECDAMVLAEYVGDVAVDIIDCFCKTCAVPMNVPDSFWREQDAKNKPPPGWEEMS